jgi:hypothetical protein
MGNQVVKKDETAVSLTANNLKSLIDSSKIIRRYLI